MPAIDAQSDNGEVLKKVLKSLLIARANDPPMTVSQLSRAYFDEECERVPYKQLGFSTFLEYLRSIPEYVRVEVHNCTAYVRHVESEKSAHISSLVSRQQSKKRCRPSTNSRFTINRTRVYNSNTISIKRIPYEHLTEILRLLASSPKGLSIRYILEHVTKRVRHIHFTMEDITRHLQQLPLELEIRGDIVYSKNQRTQIAPLPRNGDVYKSKSSDISEPKINSSHSSDPVTNTLHFEEPVTNTKTPIYCVPDDVKESDGFDGYDYEIDDDIQFSINNINNGNLPMSYNCENTLNKGYTNDIEDKLPIQNGNETNDSYLQNNGIVNGQQVAQSYESMDYEHYNREEDEENHNLNNSENCNAHNDNASDLVSERTKIRLEKLLEQHPEGIWVSDLPDTYFKAYKIELNYREMGFSNIVELVHNLPNIFHCTEPLETNRIMVIGKQQLSNRPAPQKLTLAAAYSIPDQTADDSDALPPELSYEIMDRIMPAGAMRSNEKVEEISVTELQMNAGGYEEVFVSDIFNPSFFWIQLRKKKGKFDKLMKSLHNFYKRVDSQYKIPPIAIKKGLQIACLYAGKWHRATIKKIKLDGYVIVFFYDYGTVKTYNPADLYFLDRSFSNVRAQAIPCGLYNIQPLKGAKWSQTVIDKFTRKVSNVPLIATILTIDIDNNCMMVSLTDTNDDVDVHIGDWLMENNYAQKGQMFTTVPVKNICQYDEDILQQQRRKELQDAFEEEGRIQEEYERPSMVILPEKTETAHCAPSSYVPFTSKDMEIYHMNLELMKQNIELKMQMMEMHALTKALTSKLDKNCTEDLTVSVNNLALQEGMLSEKCKMPSNSLMFDTLKTDQPFNVRDHCQSIKDKLSKCLQNVPQVTRTFLHEVEDKASKLTPGSEPSVPNYFKQSEVKSAPRKEASSVKAKSTNPFHDNFATNLIDVSLSSHSSSGSPADDIPNIKDSEAVKLSKHLNGYSHESQDKFQAVPVKQITAVNNNENRPDFLSQHGINNVDGKIIAAKEAAKIVNSNQEDEGYVTRPSTAVDNGSLKNGSSNGSKKSPSPVNISNQNNNSYLYRYELTLRERPVKFIHVMFINSEGWVCISEFVDAFTRLENPRIMLESLKIMNIPITVNKFTRSECPEIFSLLDKSEYYGLRDVRNRIQGAIEVLPLKEILHLLVKLKIVDINTLKKLVALKKEIPNYTQRLHDMYEGTVLCDLLMLLMRSREFLTSKTSISTCAS